MTPAFLLPVFLGSPLFYLLTLGMDYFWECISILKCACILNPQDNIAVSSHYCWAIALASLRFCFWSLWNSTHRVTTTEIISQQDGCTFVSMPSMSKNCELWGTILWSRQAAFCVRLRDNSIIQWWTIWSCKTVAKVVEAKFWWNFSHWFTSNSATDGHFLPSKTSVGFGQLRVGLRN